MAEAPSTDRLRILALDGDAFFRRVLEDMLSGDYVFGSVSRAADFREILDGFHPDIILLDVVLPDGNGIDLCRELKGDVRYGKIFICLLTSLQEGQAIEAGYRAGADDYIRKPFIEFEVRSKISNFGKILREQEEIQQAYRYQLSFARRLYTLNRLIQKNIYTLEWNRLINILRETREIADAGYVELVRRSGGEYLSQWSGHFDGALKSIPFSKMRRQWELARPAGEKRSFRARSGTGGDIHVRMYPLLLDQGEDGCLLVEKGAPFQRDEDDIFTLFIDFIEIMARRIQAEGDLQKQMGLYRSEIAKVREIQVSLLPRFDEVQVFDIASAFLPMEDLSGDFFDGFFLDEHTYQIILCDVSGHGAASSYIGNGIRTMFRTLSATDLTPSSLLQKVNNNLHSDIGGLYYFGTAIVCRIDIRSGSILFASGGHLPALHYSAKTGRDTWRDSTGPLIGLFPGMVYQDIGLEMDSGDCLLLYTDGITESRTEDRSGMFGEERVRASFLENVSSPSRDIVHSLLGSIYEFTGYSLQEDDITLICIKKR